MNVTATARASAVARHIQSVPVIRVSSLFTEAQFNQAMFFSNLPRTAAVVLNQLAPYAKRGTLDATLAKLLRRAQATVNGNLAREDRMAARDMPAPRVIAHRVR
jgi:hypothetical protein